MANKLELQKQEVMSHSINAKAESDKALAAERLNKIQLDAALSAERISRAEEDRTAGVLNLIKAVKEIEGLDVDALLKKVQILKTIEMGQMAQEQQSAPAAAKSQAV